VYIRRDRPVVMNKVPVSEPYWRTVNRSIDRWSKSLSCSSEGIDRSGRPVAAGSLASAKTARGLPLFYGEVAPAPVKKIDTYVVEWAA